MSKFNKQKLLTALLKKKELDDEVKNINKKVTSNQTRLVEVKNKLSDLSGEIKLLNYAICFS